MSPLRLIPTTLAAATCLIAGAVAAQCCSVPVFRYALDHWRSDPFRLEVAPADFRSEALANTLRNLGENSPFNLEADRSADSTAPSRLWAPTRSGPRNLPSANTPVWQGRLTPESFRNLTDSPARQEIARLILQGHSMVWVLVETGRPAEDEPARQLLEQRLRFLEKVSELPPIDPSDPSNKLGPGPKLAIKLGSLRISRQDPSETLLVQMLAGPQGLEALPPDKPFAAVVFGRGRVLGAWSDPDESTIEEASRFLMGACSCQVKNQNPGWDLLMATAWDDSLRAADQQRIKETPTRDSTNVPPSAPERPPATVETVVFDSVEPHPQPQASAPSTAVSILRSSRIHSSLALILVVLSLALSISARKRPRP